jgi:formylglycine-generating enzyme required for sulfatase activity
MPPPSSGTLITGGSIAAPDEQARGPLTLPGYEILDELGRGGFGVVYRARHLGLNRVVALKMILAGGHASAEGRRRFLAEARAVAALQHPHIVQVHEIGEHGGLPFFTLEFVPGGSLAARLAGQPQQPADAARLVEVLARAMHHAHRAGIVHRDLKPANVLILEGPETPLGRCTAKITDFGLAKLEGGDGHTQSGAVLGTPSYMAPEQAAGEGKRVGPAADVYALGAVLYQLLTGRPPFLAPTAHETLSEVLSDEPAPPRRLHPRLPRDLETICLKCLHKQPPRRYASAAELADDLRRFQAGEPIQARPVGALERAARWVRNRPVVAGLTAALALVVVAAFVVVGWQLRTATEALAKADREQKQRALAQVDRLRDAAPGAVPEILADLERSRADVLPRLRELWAEGGDQARRMRLALALLPVEPETARPPLAAWMLQADDPAEVLLVRDALLPYKEELREGLWARAEDARAPSGERLRALAALATFDPHSPRWAKAGEAAAGLLLAANANPFYQGQWARALKPASASMLGTLTEAFRGGGKLGEFRQTAAVFLADYAADDPERLADLLLDADPRQYAVLLPALAPRRAWAVERLRRELPPAGADGKEAPRPAPAERERLARRQAQAAATLLRLGDAEPVWPLFRHTPEPEARSQLVWRAALLGVDAGLLVERLGREKDVSARRALIAALGDYSGEQLPEKVRAPLTATLLEWYRDDPDPGVHGAVDWLLRHGQEGPAARPLDWGQAAELAKIDGELKRRDPDGKRGWYVNGQGQTMVLVPGPLEFRMGSPQDEEGRRPDEALHRRRIGRRFAVAGTPVTVEQWRQFLKDRPRAPSNYDVNASPQPDCPINGVTWYMAAQYCNWLSEKEGIPPDQWCYPGDKDVKDGMKPFPDYLQRTGYRLPTEAEWECACRAGATSSRSYGSSEELLSRYAWHLDNSRDRVRKTGRTWPVGQKRPNDLGLFDMHGGVFTWAQDGYRDYPWGAPVEDKEDIKTIKDGEIRVLRGGSYDIRPEVVRSAFRHFNRPEIRGISMGLRVARTCR